MADSQSPNQETHLLAVSREGHNSVSEAHQRADFLACALAKRLDFSPNEGVEWDKVVSIFSVNTVG